MSNVKQSSILRVIALEISEEGQVSTKQMAIDRDGQLENTLLKADYPDIRVATVDIPQQALDQYQQAMVEHSLGKNIVHDGVEYSLVGASASAKNGKYYAVDAKHAKLIAQRFRYWLRVNSCKNRRALMPAEPLNWLSQSHHRASR